MLFLIKKKSFCVFTNDLKPKECLDFISFSNLHEPKSKLGIFLFLLVYLYVSWFLLHPMTKQKKQKTQNMIYTLPYILYKKGFNCSFTKVCTVTQFMCLVRMRQEFLFFLVCIFFSLNKSKEKMIEGSNFNYTLQAMKEKWFWQIFEFFQGQ